MSEENKDDSKKVDLNETNEDGEILTLSDLLNEQREIDEVCVAFVSSKLWRLNKNDAANFHGVCIFTFLNVLLYLLGC